MPRACFDTLTGAADPEVPFLLTLAKRSDRCAAAFVALHRRGIEQPAWAAAAQHKEATPRRATRREAQDRASARGCDQDRPRGEASAKKV